MISSNQRRRMAARSFAVLARQAGRAASAALMACRVSSAPTSATWASSSPVAGLVTAKVLPEKASRHAPFT